MTVNHATPARDVSMLRLTFNETYNHTLPTRILKTGLAIENEKYKIWFTGYSVNQSSITVAFIDKKTKFIEHIDVSLRYWKSYIGDGQDSGAYIFRPLDNETDSVPYSEYMDLSDYF
jgi:hypothetical protein